MAEIERFQLVAGDGGIVYAVFVDTQTGDIECVVILDAKTRGPRFIRYDDDLYKVDRGWENGAQTLHFEKMSFQSLFGFWNSTTNDHFYQVCGYNYPFDDLRDNPPPRVGWPDFLDKRGYRIR